MKKHLKVTVIMTLLCLLITACSQKEEVLTRTAHPEKFKAELQAKREANAILFHYGKVNENQVICLDITQAEAEKLGVPKKYYDEALLEIDEVNRIVRQSLETDTPTKVELPTPQQPLDETRADQLPGGYLSGLLSKTPRLPYP